MLGDEGKTLKLEPVWFSAEKIFSAGPKDEGPRNDRARIPGNIGKSDVGSAVFARGVREHPSPAMVWLGGHFARMGGPHFGRKGTYVGAPRDVSEMTALRFFP